MPHLELHPHHRNPLDVVGLGEGRPPTAGADVPDDSLEPVVTTVPIQGERATLPVKAALSIDPSVPIRGERATLPVKAALSIDPSTTVAVRASSRSATAVRASSRSAAGASAPVWAAATLVGVRGCPLRRPRSCCLPPQQLEVRVDAVLSRNGAADAAAQGLDLCCRHTRCIHRRRCFRLCSGCCQLRRC